MEQDAADALHRRNRELEVLNAIAEGLNASVDLAQSLRTSLSRVTELLDLRTGWVWLLDEETEEPYLAAAQELPPGLAGNPGAMEGPCHCLDRFRAGELEGAANVVTCSRLRWLREGTAGLRYHASIPLHARGKRLGVMNVASAEWRALSPEELRLLHTVGDMVAVAVERARLYARSAEAGATEERNRLAREIHDTLAQGLSAITLHLETAEALLQGEAERARVEKALSTALRTARAGLEEARRSVLDLRAAPLEGRSLPDALASLAGSAPPDGPRLRFEAVGGLPPLPSRVEVGLFRIAQEAVANAVRHAEAETVVVRLVGEPHRVVLSVTDDGRGFERDVDAAGRFGLVGMRERARLLGGALAVRSAAGAGTRVRVAVPLA